MKFYHRIHGAKFMVQQGNIVKELSFAGGEFDTSSISDEAVKHLVETELRKVADVPASMIYTKQVVLASEERKVVQEIEASATAAFDNVNKIPAGTATVPMPTQQQVRPTVQEHAKTAENASGGSLHDALAAARAAVDNASKK